ncbi:cation channel sperm-associated auxiliary subunit TMEM249 [Prionailurus viverrinus]|uniref:cation channel sperm-associated auxiliary subunit TMEM249 n=1 Tax=Prionailurus viverrinus TaxID=61388 RepID=UPI001FF41056|nr:cation channel sperm-associated auxiliary subunit TMEM249 [Prionailurus viverrinus]
MFERFSWTGCVYPVLRDTEIGLCLWLCLKLCLGRSGSGKGEALLSHGVQCGAPACRYLCSLGLGHPATFPSAAPSWTAALEPFFSQTPKGRVGGLPTTSGGKRFQLWALGLFCTERHLAKRLKNNSFYPFIQQQPNVFVLEYYLDTLWKGTLLFVVCLLLVSFGFVSQVQKQETWGFPACGVVVGLWLMISSLPRRRLVLNHTRGTYHFSVQGRTVCQGPMHLVYVRLALSSDAYGRCFFQLVLCGHKLEPLVLVQLSERYEQMEYLGRHIARKLNINYFDCLAKSYRHVVRHWPLGATFSPGIVQRKTGTYGQQTLQSDLDV